METRRLVLFELFFHSHDFVFGGMVGGGRGGGVIGVIVIAAAAAAVVACDTVRMVRRGGIPRGRWRRRSIVIVESRQGTMRHGFRGTTRRRRRLASHSRNIFPRRTDKISIIVIAMSRNMIDRGRIGSVE